MIAEAIRQTHPELKFIQVDTQAIRVTDTKRRQQLTFMTPVAVQDSIIAFDEGEQVKLFRFQLRDPRVRQMAEKSPGRRGEVSRGDRPGMRRTKTVAGAHRLGRLRVHGLRAIGRRRAVASAS